MTVDTVTLRQPWIHSAKFDFAFIFAPFVVTLAAVFLFKDYLMSIQEFPLWFWVLITIILDRSHNWVTFYRIYFDASEFKKDPKLYLYVPFLCWSSGVFFYSLGSQVFWRVVVYSCVFHQIRQYYGFFAIYSREEKVSSDWIRKLDKFLIYYIALFPYLYWHFHPRAYNIFEAGDFLLFPTQGWDWIIFILFFSSLLIFLGKEIYFFSKTKIFNIPKVALVMGAALMGLVGIVIFNNYIIFMLSISPIHNISYFALTWLYCKNKRSQSLKILPQYVLPLLLFVALGFGLAEEGLWSGLVYREHLDIFPDFFSRLPHLQDPRVLMWVMPFLMLPVTTHCALDAFIWRFKKGQDPDLRRIFSPSTAV